MSNPLGYDYPAGAENDPRAPWNQTTPEECVVCEKCDGEGEVRCGHCRAGFAPDYSHPTQMRLKSCDTCDGGGKTTCEACDGTGVILLPTREENAMEKADRAMDEEKDERE